MNNRPTNGSLLSKALQGVLLLGLCQPLYSQETNGDTERGAQLYYEFACYACHGYNASGRTPLSRETSGILSSEELFIRYLRLRADQNPINPKNSMPNYDVGTLSDAKASDIYAYLVSLQDNTPEIDDIPTMQEIIDAAERRTDVEPNDE